MNLGATLRQARIAQGLTCNQLARITRISPRIIVAMEQDEWTQVPRGIFTRGYLRAYAREVGLDGAALVARFAAENAPPPPLPPDPPLKEPVSKPRRAAGYWRRPIAPDVLTRRERIGLLSFVPILALLLLIVLPGWPSVRENRSASPQPSPAAAPSTANTLGGQPPETIGTASSRAIDAAPSAATGALPDPTATLVVDVSATRPCWVTAWTDGQRSVYRLVRPGDRVQARGFVLTFHVGDAGALQLTLNGQLARPLGANGEVATVRITRDNYRSLLASRSGT